MTRLTATLLALFAALIWGVAFYFQKAAMAHVGPLLFLGIRSLLAVLALLPFAVADGSEPGASNGSILPFGLLGGLVFFIAAAIQQTGIVTATVTNTSFLTALYVVATPLLLWLLRQDRPDVRVWLAVALAFAGIWLLGGGTLDSFSTGDVLVAISSVFWASHMVVTSRAGKQAQPLRYTCISFAVVAAIALPLAMVLEEVSWSAITDAALPLLFVGFVSSAFTFGLIAIVMRHLPATHVSILISTETLFGAAAGHIMLGERLPLVGWAGAALVLAAVLLIQTRKV